ncbi:hypothetical protein G6O69_02100 [Pseudenhygromyxa sp. WMMC2535]|uniref:hypothetical protein n=1 Tax=Pseudenhygromyxa sp. WMMC2535 TaxID=2712867 RepID=UPI00155729FC|nr:hypothetical protein [Pseudenhygromyxa sp. WMMC2535]NVB36607.1 hypothetical protein [Pseudenhygromyxa sp. WMMC2535]
MSDSPPRSLAFALGLALSVAPACRSGDGGSDNAASVSPFAARAGQVVIQPAPEHLRGRVALPAGARVYTRPSFSSPSYELRLPQPPLSAGEAPPRARALRVVGVIEAPAGDLSAIGNFLAVTNDLANEADSPGCGLAPRGIEHLRMLLFVPEVHLAEIIREPLELVPLPGPQTDTSERLRVAPGARVGPPLVARGMPTPPPGARWRWVDADGVRTIAPVPDAAVGKAWDPSRGLPAPEGGAQPGDPLMRDAEGSTLWLRDEGGESVALSVRNSCGEHDRLVDAPGEVEDLRALALDVFYDQRPPAEPPPAIEPDADFLIPSGEPLRWPDGDLAGELLRDWSIALGVGQTWNDLRCFALPLGPELEPFEREALICVRPDSLVALDPVENGDVFGRSELFELGGTVELGPVLPLTGGPWDDSSLRTLLNRHHDSVGECLRSLAGDELAITGSRWELALTVDEDGHVDDLNIDALGPSNHAVEDCLRAEVFTWTLPPAAGELVIPVTLGSWSQGGEGDALDPDADPDALDPNALDPDALDPDADPDAAEPEPEPEPEPERGKVFIIRDEEDDADLEELEPSP